MNALRTHLLCLTVLALAIPASIPALADEPAPDAVVPVVGSTLGAAGASFRTEAQLHNPTTATMRGRLVFVWQGIPIQPNPVAELEYLLAPRQTIAYEDLVAAMGGNGLGSIDVFAVEGGVPTMIVRAFDDQGAAGTTGLMVPVLRADQALTSGRKALLVVPGNLSRYRFNIGVRTLPSEYPGARLRLTVFEADGTPAGDSFLKDVPLNFFAQAPGDDFIGRPLSAGSSILAEVLEGRIILYSTTTDNLTNDGSIQIDRVLNLPPVLDATVFHLTTPAATPVTVPLTVTDPDDDPVSALVSSEPAHGTVTISVDEAAVTFRVTYSPDAGFEGEDGFTLLFDDGNGGTTTVTFSVTVGGDNASPIALGNSYTIVEGETLSVPAPGVLGNDVDADGDPLTAVLETAPVNAASFNLGDDGSLTYTPVPGFIGTDSFTYRASDGTATSNLATVVISVRSSNTPPVAVADVATTDEDTPILIDVLANDTDAETPGELTLVGVTTTGTLGTVTTVGNQVRYDPTTSAVLQALGPGDSTVDTFQYTVRDPEGLTASATVSVTVTGVDDLPVAVNDAATIPEDAGATVIDVLANDTDAEGDAITITGVTQGANGAVVITGGGTGLTYEPNPDFNGADSFTYTVNGGSTATVSVTVTEVNDAPTATDDTATTAEDTPLVIAGSTLTANDSPGPANEAGQTLTVTAVTSPSANGGTVSLSGGNVTYNPPVDFIGTDTFTYTVTDDGTTNGAPDPLSANGTVTVTVLCPTITVNNPANANGTAGTAFSETFTQTGDAAGVPPVFTTSSTLPAGLTLATSGVLSGTPTEAGTFPIVVTATNGNACAGTGSTYELVIGCPTITVTNPINATGPAGTPFSETFTETGAVGTATFTTASTLPTGLTLSTAGVLSGTPTEGGTFPIVVTVTDASGCTGTSATYNLVITCPTITVTSPANSDGTANVAFSETFTSSGGIGTMTYTLATGTLPAGLSLAANGVLSGTPTETGSFPITVLATDSNGCTGTSSTYTIEIACQTITVENPANAGGTANAAFSETFTQTGGIGTTTFTLASGTLPAGLTLAANGVLSGTPTETGSFPITVTATDSNGCTGTGATYNLDIACQTITVTNPANAAGAIGAAFSETFTQTGAIGSAAFTTASTLPNGFTLSAAGVLSGTPTENGTFPIVVTVTDSNGCTGSGATYNLVIGCQTITVTNPANVNGTVGAVFSETFTQTGAIGSATFTTASALPAGLTLSTAGVLSGTPTQSGTFPIVVTVTDSNGCTGTGATYNLVIACNVITVTNPANANGTAGTAFSETFTQTGGNGTITWSVTGTLPAGITLDTSTGVLSGTTTAVGSFPITVTATDANGCSGTGATYTLAIACQTITVTNPANANGTAGAAFSETFTQTGILGTPTWSVTGTLPAGITINTSTGVLSGTTSQTGSFPVTVRVTDTNGCFDDSPYTLTIVCQTITVTNPVVTSGSYNVAFSQTFGVTGILGTATWSVTGTLPAGISIGAGGVLSGTPTQTGSFPVTVRATDTNGCFGESSYTLTIAPTANPDSYTNLINNTQAVVIGGNTASPATPFARLAFASNLIANDASDAPITATAETVATTQGGSVTIAADGTFVYTPPVSGVATPLATDGFNYTITSNGISVGGTASITLTQRVWYVRNNAAGGGLGRSSDPFDTLAEAAAASFANDYIFVHYGGGTTTGQNAGIVLKNGQSLIGEFMGLSLPVSVNGQGAPAVLLAQPTVTACGGGPCRPIIGHTVANNTVVTATDAIPAQISGFRLDPSTGTSNAIDVTTTGAFGGSGTLVINQNVIEDAGAEGIDINAGGTGTLTLDIQNNTTSATGTTGNAIDVTRTGGTVIANISNNTNLIAGGTGINVTGGAAASTTITGFANNTIHGNTGGAGVVISNVTFDAIPGGNFDVVSGGNTVVGASGNGVGTSGITLTTVSGHLNFTDLDIFTTNGAGLTVTGTGALAAASGTQVTVQNTSTSDVSATNGPAVSVSNATLNTVFNSVTSTNSSSTGVSLTTVGGTFTAGTGSAITNATGTDFAISGGNANVTYNGTITDTSGTVVSVASTTGGTKVFGGAISSGAISLTSNTGATINFTGGLTLSTGASAAFTATGGGTVNVTGSTNTLTTTTGTALNVANTTIGASGLTFRSISSNGAVSGIVLNATGSSGSLTVSGTGAAGSGGTIQSSTGPGISLTTVGGGVSLSYMNIQNGGDDGIRGSTVSGLNLTGVSVTSNGNAAGEAGIDLSNLTGSGTWSSVTVSGSAEDNVVVRNNTGTLSSLTVTGSTFSSNSAIGNDGFLVEASGTASMTVSVTGSTFTAHRGDHFQAAAANSGVMNATFTGNTLTGGHATALGQGITINAATGVPGYAGTVTYNVSNNTINGSILSAITANLGTSAAGSLMSGTISGNIIGTAATFQSGSTQASGITVEAHGNGTHTTAVTNNTIRQAFDRGINVLANDGSGTLNMTVTGNNVSHSDGTNSREGFFINNGSTDPNIFGVADAHFVCLTLGGAGALMNTLTHGPGAPDDFRMRQRFNSTIRLPGYGGGATDTAAVVAFVNGNNTSTTGSATVNSPPGGGFVGGAACPMP